jgi:opacity protein-like surface antigen
MTMPVAARGTPLLLAALLAAAAAPLAAQVGFDPGRSPFHDLTTRQAFTVSAGYFGGNQANAGVGWRQAALFGGRLDTRLGGPFDLYVSVGVAGSSRYRIDTSLDTATRKTGPFARTLVLADLGIILNVTGAKTWHGLAPYAGFGIGEVLPTKSETDVGGYNAGTNFAMIPILGTRVLLARALAVRIEVRDYFFRYEWPLRYFDPLDNNGNPISPGILSLGLKDKQWTNNFTLTVGLAYGFNF